MAHPVFSHSQFEVSDDADSMQMLQRSPQVGEFYNMMSPAVGWTDAKGHENFLDIVIYDEEADKHVHITFEAACKAAGLLDAGAAGIDLGKITAACPWTSDVPNAIKDAKDGKYNANTKNVCLVVCRPFIEHLMMSAVMTVSGRDTGATLFGPAGKRLHTTFVCCLLQAFRRLIPCVGVRRHADQCQHVGQDHRGPREYPRLEPILRRRCATVC